jgi:hypothetical protein
MHHAPRDIFSRLRGETRCRSPLSRSGEKYGDGRVEQAGPLGLGDQPLSVPLPVPLRSTGRGGFDAAANICARRGGKCRGANASKRCGATPADRRQPAIAPADAGLKVHRSARRYGGCSASLRPYRVTAIGRRGNVGYQDVLLTKPAVGRFDQQNVLIARKPSPRGGVKDREPRLGVGGNVL